MLIAIQTLIFLVSATVSHYVSENVKLAEAQHEKNRQVVETSVPGTVDACPTHTYVLDDGGEES